MKHFGVFLLSLALLASCTKSEERAAAKLSPETLAERCAQGESDPSDCVDIAMEEAQAQRPGKAVLLLGGALAGDKRGWATMRAFDAFEELFGKMNAAMLSDVFGPTHMMCVQHTLASACVAAAFGAYRKGSAEFVTKYMDVACTVAPGSCSVKFYLLWDMAVQEQSIPDVMLRSDQLSKLCELKDLRACHTATNIRYREVGVAASQADYQRNCNDGYSYSCFLVAQGILVGELRGDDTDARFYLKRSCDLGPEIACHAGAVMYKKLGPEGKATK